MASYGRSTVPSAAVSVSGGGLGVYAGPSLGEATGQVTLLYPETPQQIRKGTPTGPDPI